MSKPALERYRQACARVHAAQEALRAAERERAAAGDLCMQDPEIIDDVREHIENDRAAAVLRVRAALESGR